MNQYNPTDAADIIRQIEQVNEPELAEILSAVIHRYSTLRPDRKMATFSLSTDPQTRTAELENIIHLIHKYENRREQFQHPPLPKSP